MPNDTVSAATQGLPAKTRDIDEVIFLLCRAISLNELIFIASESELDGDLKEVFTTGVDVVNGVLKEAKTILYANKRKGGAA